MIVADQPEVQYAYRRNLSSKDALSFIGELEALDPQAIVAHHSGKLKAERGIWVRIGSYRHTNGSFIDPSDLMLYVEYYFEPAVDGPTEALELNHGANPPDGALCASTLDELLDALAQLDYCEEPAEGDAPDDEDHPATDAEDDMAAAVAAGPEHDGADGQGGAASTEPQPEQDEDTIMPSRLDGMTIVEPSGAPEMHGALVEGWHAMYYESADGPSLLVFD